MKITKFEIGHPDEYGEMPQSIEMAVTNTTDKIVSQIRYELICYDPNGIACYGKSGVANYLNLSPGDFHSISESEPLPADVTAGESDDVKLVCDLRLFSCNKYDLGTYDVSIDDNGTTKNLKEIDSQDIKSPISVRIHRRITDEDGDVTVVAECAISSNAQSAIEIIEVRADLLGPKGNVIEDQNFTERFIPGITTYIQIPIWTKRSKLKGAKVKMTLYIYEMIGHERTESISTSASN